MQSVYKHGYAAIRLVDIGSAAVGGGSDLRGQRSMATFLSLGACLGATPPRVWVVQE